MNRFRTASGSKSAGIGSGGREPTALEPDSSPSLIGDRVRQKYEGLGAMAQERFDRYVKAAELYVQQGQHYRAADSFTLASMYKPQELRPYLSKAHALLAAGEYVSSAISLGKAIELDPRASLKRIDLIEAIGGPDRFVERISDLEQTAGRGDAPQLQFLLAYVYYQMDRLPQAKTAIQAAARDLPPSPSLDALKMAIGR